MTSHSLPLLVALTAACIVATVWHLFNRGESWRFKAAMSLLMACIPGIWVVAAFVAPEVFAKTQEHKSHVETSKTIRVPRNFNRIIVAVPSGQANSFDYFDLPRGSEVYAANDEQQVLVLELGKE